MAMVLNFFEHHSYKANISLACYITILLEKKVNSSIYFKIEKEENEQAESEDAKSIRNERERRADLKVIGK